MRNYILKVRPMISILENVEKLGQDYVQTDDEDCAVVLNDLSWIIADFAEHAMTAVSAPVDRARFDSPHDGVRQWLAIYDVHPDIARPHLPFFHRLLDSMASPRGGPRMSLAPFLFDEDIVQELMEGVQVKPSKAAKTALDWQDTHESVFQYLSLSWPPEVAKTVSSHHLFRPREGEVIWLANEKFPAVPCPHGLRIVLDCFDANNSFCRVFQWPGKDRTALKNPWRKTVPCLSGESVVAVRAISKNGTVTIRRLLGWEALRLQGWDIDMWLPAEMDAFATDKLKHTQLLTSLAANMWSLFQYLPVLTATLACLPLQQCREEHVALMQRIKASQKRGNINSVSDTEATNEFAPSSDSD